MAADNLYQLFGFADQFSDAAGGILAAAGFSNPYSRGSSDAVTDTATFIRFDPGPATGAVCLIPRGSYRGRSEYCQFTGTLAVQRQRPRKGNATVADIEGVQRELGRDAGKISACFLRARLPFTADNLPWLEVSDIRPQGAEFGVDERHHIDGVTLTWLITFAIRLSAWPDA